MLLAATLLLAGASSPAQAHPAELESLTHAERFLRATLDVCPRVSVREIDLGKPDSIEPWGFRVSASGSSAVSGEGPGRIVLRAFPQGMTGCMALTTDADGTVYKRLVEGLESTGFVPRGKPRTRGTTTSERFEQRAANVVLLVSREQGANGEASLVTTFAFMRGEP